MANSYRLPLSSNPEFTPLPANGVLTPEQSNALWGGNIDGLLRAIQAGTEPAQREMERRQAKRRNAKAKS